MKKTFLIDVFRNIQKRIVSWLSIVAIVLIGTSVILGLHFTATSLSSVGARYISEHNYKDLNIACSMGVTEKEVEEIRSIEGVADAEGVVAFTGQLGFSGKNIGAMILSVTERISVPYAVEGQLPAENGQCAINRELADKLGVSIGDTVTVVVSAARIDNVLTENKYTVTGIAGHPDYMGAGRMDYCLLPISSFDTSGSAFDYTAVYAKAETPKGAIFSDKRYNEAVKAVYDNIQARIDGMTIEKKNTIANDLDGEYKKAEDKANAELSKAKKQIDDAQKEFDEKIGEASQKLEDGKKEYEEGEAKAKQELSAAAKKIKDGEEEYNTKIADGQRQLEEAEKKMEDELSYNKWKLFDGFLQLDEAEKKLKEKEEEYNAGRDKLIRGKEELDKGWEEYNSGISRIDEVLDSETIDILIEGCEGYYEDPEITDEDKEQIRDIIIPELMDSKGKDALARGYAVMNVYDFAMAEVDPKVLEVFDEITGISDFRAGLDKLSEGKKKLDDGQREYENGLEELEEARKLLDQGWYSLEQGRRELADGQAALAKKEPEARKQLADAKADFEVQKADGAKQLEDAKKTYAARKKEAEDQLAAAKEELDEGIRQFNEQKKKGEKELSEAKEKYDKAYNEAMDTLASVKKQIDEAKNTECQWFVQTRDANIYFVEFKSNCGVLKNVGRVFTPIYAGIVIIVCFFTMAIIVEEQSKQIGTCKALGMYKTEIRKKYLLFGVTAAVLGALIGIGGGLALEKIICNSLNTSFVFNIEHVFRIMPIIIMPVGAAIVTAFAVVWSSEKILSCSAVGLVSGNEPAKRGRSKGAKSSKGSVYFRLILNNFLMDLGRETVSVVIILVCVFLIGLGSSIKLGHYNALKNQVEQVNRYDLTVTLSDNVTEEQKAKIEDVIHDYDYMEVCKIGGVIQTGKGQILTELYVVDDTERFREFYFLKNGKGGESEIFDDALMVTFEMMEKNGLKDGQDLTLITDSLDIASLTIRGHYLLHVGKGGVMTAKYYKSAFGKDPELNTYMIKVGDKDPKSIADMLEEYDGISAIHLSDEILDLKAALSKLYTTVVFIVIGFSIILSFMILLNLSNILVAHMMKELLTMRVNGFSNAEVIGYLVREVLVTTGLGIMLGLLIGIPATSVIIRSVESDGFMFLRKTYASAWILAVSCETLFTLIINTISFSRVNKVPLSDITKY